MRWAGFLPPMFMRSSKLSVTTKLSAEHATPPIANVLLPPVLLISSLATSLDATFLLANFSSVRLYSIYSIVKSAEKIITSCKKCINHAQKIPLVSSIDLVNNHPKNPASITPKIPRGFPQ